MYGPALEPEQIDWSRWAGLDKILYEWNLNKTSTLLKLMNNKLILRRPYSYIAQEEAIASIIEKSLKNYNNNFIDWWNELRWGPAIKNTEIEFLDHAPNKPGYNDTIYNFLLNFLTPENLAKNSYQGENCIITFPSKKTFKIFHGMKPMKILAKFIQEFDGPEDEFEQFRIWHSKQLNQKRMDGELCLSIHPLDFMTMSDNANDWSSCMRWMPLRKSKVWNHGDYRGGTVSCMNSPYIIVAYLHNPEHKFKINDDWEWNSKQWRELFIVQEEVINEVKGYCFQDENLTNTVLMWIKELAAQNLNWTYDNKEVNISENVNTKEKPIYLLYEAGTFMYNDIGTLPLHRGRINLEKILNNSSIQEVKKDKNKDIWSYFLDVPYGGEATCMCCGCIIDPDNASEDAVFCNDCDNVSRCACCGEPIRRSELYWVDEYDSPICEYCWENESSYDAFEYDSTHLISNMEDISLLLGYDENGNKVWYDYTVYCYQPQYNPGYQEAFYEEPCRNLYRTYTTVSMIRPGQDEFVADAFGVRGIRKHEDWNKILKEYGVVRWPEDPIIEED